MEILCEQMNLMELYAEMEAEMVDIETIQSSIDTTADTDGDTWLHVAIITNQTHIAMALISKYRFTHFISLQNNLYQSPLILASLTNQVEVCRMLVDAGAELESRDKDGNSALHIACRDGLVDIVKSLLGYVRHGQNIVAQTSRRRTQDLSIRNYSGYSCIHIAAMNGHIDIMELLLQNGADINIAEGKTGRTILHSACAIGDVNLVKTLLRYRSCNINARAFDDCTPFDIARARGHDMVCMALAIEGANQSDSNIDSD